MRAERDKRAAILNAEGAKQSAILNAEGEQQAAVLRADGDAKAAVLRAEGEAKEIPAQHPEKLRRLRRELFLRPWSNLERLHPAVFSNAETNGGQMTALASERGFHFRRGERPAWLALDFFEG